MPFETSQGITFTFDDVQYTATAIVVSRGRMEHDVSSTDLDLGSKRRLRLGELNEVSLKVDWIGGTIPTVTRTAMFRIVGTSDIGVDEFAGKPALCTGLSITGNAGELIRGSATFKLSED